MAHKRQDASPAEKKTSRQSSTSRTRTSPRARNRAERAARSRCRRRCTQHVFVMTKEEWEGVYFQPPAEEITEANRINKASGKR
eukprot:COSAG01_NODE_1011_length_12147_cov_12.737384_2_plen_84_part_00